MKYTRKDIFAGAFYGLERNKKMSRSHSYIFGYHLVFLLTLLAETSIKSKHHIGRIGLICL